MLKNFEEPLPDRCIILTASHIDDVLPTIVSRATLVYCPQDSIKNIQERYTDTVYEAACRMVDLIVTDTSSARIAIAKETKNVAMTLHVLEYIDCLIECVQTYTPVSLHSLYIPRLIQAKKYITSNVSKEHVLYSVFL